MPTSLHQYRRHHINTDVTTSIPTSPHYTDVTAPIPTSPHDTDLAAALVLVEVDETADAADDVTTLHRRHYTTPTSPHDTDLAAALVLVEVDETADAADDVTTPTPTSPHDTDLAAALVLVKVDETADAADDVTVFIHDDERGSSERRLRVDQRVKVQQHVVTHAGVSKERATLHTLA